MKHLGQNLKTRPCRHPLRRVAVPHLIARFPGTRQLLPITEAVRAAGVRSQPERPWNRRDHAFFLAFAPEDALRLTLTVVAEHGGLGSTVDAPIARDIVPFARHGDLPPEASSPAAQRARVREDLARLSKRILPRDHSSTVVSRT
ncbi:MAG TPA: hypothetical protein PLI43_07570 [Albidovulum sp.]|uniref:hypothetical protein n=1 Tax=Albidovulum sp. TaxID=1872424 RepID=UPI002B8BA10A|nr:hypothetical protein [Albidovulum sp.]